jgi:SAM-dependent methyltransferase
MVAHALEAPRALLPHLPELLADFQELGSDTALIVQVLKDLHLPARSFVVDLGCGKGATAIGIAAELGCRVLGVELFEPFVAHCRVASRHAGVGDLCEFRLANAAALAGQLPPADAVVFAALGDVLGSPSETMRIIRQYTRPGGFVIVADVFLREGGSTAFEGFENSLSHRETVSGLTAWGDTLIRQADATVHISGNLVGAVWAIKRA